jgi:hypothetical protein
MWAKGWGVLEIIRLREREAQPLEPDPGNTGEGNGGDYYAVIPYIEGMTFFMEFL